MNTSNKDSRDYANLQKNTVSASCQLKDCDHIRFLNPDGKGKRILFAGNSITLHGPKADIGWHGQWGMAASEKEKDYVHLIISETGKDAADCVFCICQVAEWEIQFKNGKTVYPKFENARSFNADIIVMRFVENCPSEDFDKQVFKKETADLLAYLNPSGKAEIILTTGFWRHPADSGIIELAEEMDLPLVPLGDLGDRDDMKALGLFEHSGVANHPGDLGMKHIADRIFEVLKNYL